MINKMLISSICALTISFSSAAVFACDGNKTEHSSKKDSSSDKKATPNEKPADTKK